MKDEEKKIDLIKHQWSPPSFFILSTKKTADGDVEADYEDTRYTNPLGSP
jgi:hypothetical protein